MCKIYYIDTCIWRDYYENRISIHGEPFGEIAIKLFLKIIKENNIILFSDLVINELKKDYSKEEIIRLFNLPFISKILKKIKISKEDIKEAQILSIKKNVSFGDCLHAILAKNNKAVLITQNVKDFKKLKEIVIFKKPQELI
jgi:predicted nucleic acid-binding protein